MAADGKALCIARSSAAMVLTAQDKQTFVFHEEWFTLPVPSQCPEITGSGDNLEHECWNVISILVYFCCFRAALTKPCQSSYHESPPAHLQIYVYPASTRATRSSLLMVVMCHNTRTNRWDCQTLPLILSFVIPTMKTAWITAAMLDTWYS